VLPIHSPQYLGEMKEYGGPIRHGGGLGFLRDENHSYSPRSSSSANGSNSRTESCPNEVRHGAPDGINFVALQTPKNVSGVTDLESAIVSQVLIRLQLLYKMTGKNNSDL